MDWDIIFYESSDGKCDVQEFLDNLTNKKLKAKTLRTIDLLMEFGPNLKEPSTKHIEDDIWELRTKQSTNITRILYFMCSGNKFILLNGFVKKDDETPAFEKAKAKRYCEDYKRRFLE